MQQSFPSRPVLTIVPRAPGAKPGGMDEATLALNALVNGLTQLAGTTAATAEPHRVRTIAGFCIENLRTYLAHLNEQVQAVARVHAEAFGLPRPVAQPRPEFLHDAEGRN
jgi:hypothetical protein